MSCVFVFQAAAILALECPVGDASCGPGDDTGDDTALLNLRTSVKPQEKTAASSCKWGATGCFTTGEQCPEGCQGAHAMYLLLKKDYGTDDVVSKAVGLHCMDQGKNVQVEFETGVPECEEDEEEEASKAGLELIEAKMTLKTKNKIVCGGICIGAASSVATGLIVNGMSSLFGWR